MRDSISRPTTVPSETPRPTPTDENLMVLIQSQLQQGLALLHARYAGFLKGLGMKVLHNDADAEDLVQDVFLEIWHRAPSYDPMKGRPLSWLATLTTRRAIDRLRKRDTYGRVEDRYADETRGHAEGWTHVHEDVSHSERSQQLQHALGRLPEAQRSAIHLAYYGEMTQREIAAHTAIPLGTIKTRLELGLRKMAVLLCSSETRLSPKTAVSPRIAAPLQPNLAPAR